MLTNPNTTLEEGLADEDDLIAEDILPYGSSVDVWAVGVIAYELVTGAAPFSRKGDTENDTMQRIMHWHDTEFPGSLSQQWAHFCRYALHKYEKESCTLYDKDNTHTNVPASRMYSM